VERLDGSLAPVTYLFGAKPSPDLSNDSEEDTAEEWTPDATSEPSRRTSSGRESPVTSPATEERWATPGIDHTPSSSMHDNSKDVPIVYEKTPAEPTREERRAHNVGLNALTRKGQSVAEMTAVLESRDLDEETVAAEIKRLKSVGLLDDFELAETLVRTLTERKGLGRSGIMNELRQRKINPVAIDSALEELDGDDELSRATEIAIKRAGQLSSYDATTAKRRLSAFLQRRGFSGSVVSAATNAALSRSSTANSSGPRFV
jgi:regulatory protein